MELKKTISLFNFFGIILISIFINSCALTTKKSTPKNPTLEKTIPSPDTPSPTDPHLIHVPEKITLYKSKESPLSNFLVDLLQKSTETDFAFLSENEILESSLEEKNYSPGELPRFFDKKSEILTLKLNGQQLYLFLKILSSDAFEFIAPSKLQYKMIDKKYISHAMDLNEDQILSPWEVNRIVSITPLKGKKIYPTSTYTVTLTQLLWERAELKWFREKHLNLVQAPSIPTQEALEKIFFTSFTRDTLLKKTYFQTLTPRVQQLKPL